jgi:hypothetical protein
MKTRAAIAAFHESGHGVVAFHHGRAIRRITVGGDGNGGVICAELSRAARWRFSRRDWRTHVEAEIMICLSGPIAEQKFSGTCDLKESEVDFRMARAWLKDLDHPASLRQLEAITRKLIDENWGAVSRVAARLIRHGLMSGKEVEAICRAHTI